MRIGEICGIYGAQIPDRFRDYEMESKDEGYNNTFHHRRTRVFGSGWGLLNTGKSSKKSWIALKSKGYIFVMPPDIDLEKSDWNMFRCFTGETQAIVSFVLDTNEFHNESGIAASLAEFNEIKTINFLQKSLGKSSVLKYEEAMQITRDAFSMFSMEANEFKPYVQEWRMRPRKKKQSKTKRVEIGAGYNRETKIWCDGWDSLLHSHFFLFNWIAVHGKDSVCVVTQDEVSKRFLKDLSYDLEVYPLFGMKGFVGQSLKRSFLMSPFAVVSVGVGLKKDDAASVAEIEAVEFLAEQIKNVPSFTFEVTVQTAIDALICLAPKDMDKKDIQVCVLRKGKLPVKERILFKEIGRVNEIIKRLQGRMKPRQHIHRHGRRSTIALTILKDVATDTDLTEEGEEDSRLMDVVQDNLNFKRNLVQKNTFRMGNKPDHMVVGFRNLKARKDVFYLEFGKHDPYNVVVGRVAQKLGVYKVRLTRHNCYVNEPDPDHIEFLDGCLLDVLIIHDKICNVLYYEVLDDPQVDLAHSIKLNVSYGYPYEKTSVVLPRQSRVQDLLNDIKPKMKLANSDAELRLLGIYNYKIYKFFHVEEKIEDIPEEANLWVKQVLEEKNLDHGHHLISIYHYTKMVNGVIVKFGEPFLFVIRDNETLAEVKVRIQEKLALENEEFSKWKFTLLCLGGRLRYLEDSDVVYNCFEGKQDVLQLYLGLEHCIKYEEEDDDAFITTHLDDFSDAEVSGSDGDGRAVVCST